MTLSPNPIVGGSTVAGWAALQCAAGPMDILVTLTSTKPVVASPAPSTVTVPVGARTVPFE